MQLVFPEDYFKDEEREGFLVVEKMKRAWASQMQVLSEFSEICERHGLTWCAGWGTLLGAVRHKGFIPWDDDMDIFMPRADYDRFINDYINELPKHYAHLNFYNNEQYHDYMTRLVNHQSVDYTEEMMTRYHGCPYACGIDLVPIDYIPRDPRELELYNTLIELTSQAAETIASGDMSESDERQYIAMIEKAIDRKLDKTKPIPQQLRIIAESYCKMYDHRASDKMGVGVRQFEYPEYNFPKSCFSSFIKVPFEGVMEVYIPKDYHEVLVCDYGENYMTPEKFVSHDYPFYKKQEEELERKKIKKSLYFEESEVPMSDFLNGLDYYNNDNLPHLNIGENIWKEVKARIIRNNNGVAPSENGILEAQKRSLLSLLDITEEIIELCQRDEDIELFKDHLGLLQESVITAGENIEALLGEGVNPIPLLESICEETYRLSLEDRPGTEADLSGIEALVDDARDAINSLPKKLNVIFLPYKYSMWDSLESIYIAAANDKEVEATVMPIPYVERNDKGGPGVEFYEVDKFQGRVPVVLCNQYDIEQDRPDAIFIHNPYDGGNYVTSVFPQFYASELKKHTDCLVYVPYCMYHPNGCGTHDAQVSGVIHANMCFLQSDFLRDLFKKYYAQGLSNFNIEVTKEELDEKFFGTGSPKLERMFNELRSYHPIPQEWREMIFVGEPRKKVVFWDTHLNRAMKKNSAEFARKLNSVFDYFENREDAILWWRPHPILMHTIVSMNPDFKEEYVSIVERAKASKHIIYDDLDDAYTGLSMSDCFFGGNFSSLSYMYENTGRPIYYADYSGETK